MNTTIPFSGFYESQWSYELDQAEEQLVDSLTGTNDTDPEYAELRDYDPKRVAEELFYVMDYKKAHAEMAREYAECFAGSVDRLAKWELGLTFDEMVSPREYNFTTDRLFMHIPETSVRRLRAEVSLKTFEKLIRDRFTSYDGFSSSYSNTLREWPTDLAEWDHNHVGTLLEAWLITQDEAKIEDEIFDYMQGNGYASNAVWGALDLEALKARLPMRRETDSRYLAPQIPNADQLELKI